MEKMMQTRKYVYLDFLRIIAIFGVVFNHTGEHGWLYYMHSTGIISKLYLVFSVLCKVSVPIFLMISGVLLMEKEETIKELFFKRVSKAVALILFISLVNYLHIGWLNSYQLSIRHFFTILLTTYDICSYYLWLYLALILMMPFLRKIAKNIQDDEVIYLYVIYLIVHLVFPIMGISFSNLTQYLNITSGVIMFPLLGYLIVYRNLLKDRKVGIFAGGMVILTVIVICCLLKYEYFKEQHINTEYFDGMMSVVALYLLYISKLFFECNSEKNMIRFLTPYISLIGQLVLGIFLLSDIVKAHTYRVYVFLNSMIPYNISLIIWVCIIIIISGMITYMIRLIFPPIRKVIG